MIPSPFVVGVPRSGTTLLRLMLDAHPDLAIPPETNFFPGLLKKCREASDSRACFVRTLASFTRWPDFHLDESRLVAAAADINPFSLGEALRAFYQIYAAGFGKTRWGDKSPRYLGHMKQINDVLPEAHFIQVIRDGRDVALSVLGLWFGPDSIEEAADWWVLHVSNGRGAAADLPHYLEVRFEDLIHDTETTLRRICRFISLPWDSTMLNYYAGAHERVAELTTSIVTSNGRTVSAEERRDIFSMTTRPPDPSRACRWKQEMTSSEQRRFETVAGDLLLSLGYERMTV